MVLNLSYGIQGKARYTHVPGILEMVVIPLLVEQYIDGREINVGLLGNNPPEAFLPFVLPVSPETGPITIIRRESLPCPSRSGLQRFR
jgi:hypothetical protein